MIFLNGTHHDAAAALVGNLVRTADGRLQEVVVPDALAAGAANGRSSGGRGGRGGRGRGGRTLLLFGVPRCSC